MPIVDVLIVGDAPADDAPATAQTLADALGTVLASPPGNTWVRLHRLDAGSYAENHASLTPDELPVFVTVLQAQPPSGAALIEQVAALTREIARCVSRRAAQVHVEYAPSGAGRIAFGGKLVA